MSTLELQNPIFLGHKKRLKTAECAAVQSLELSDCGTFSSLQYEDCISR